MHPYIFSLFLKPKFFKWACSTSFGYFGAHMQKPKEGDTTWELKHMTRTLEQPVSMALKTYTYNGGLLHGIISHPQKNTICT